MNYLAHSYLSFSDGQIVGQFVEDFIKNRDRFSFPDQIVKGIQLHREIDTFTDAHPQIHEAKKVFSPLVRLYSGAFIDVAFDYFLANSLPDDFLKAHSARVYSALHCHYEFLPEKLVFMLERMEKDNWLYNYKNNWGIEFSFKNVLNKAKYLDKSVPVFEAFLKNKSVLQIHFERFFPDLEAHCKKFVHTL